MFWIIIYCFFLVNIKSIHLQKQCLIDMYYVIAKEIVKMHLNSKFFFPKDKTLSNIRTHAMKTP